MAELMQDIGGFERREAADSVAADLDYIENGNDPLLERAQMSRLLYQEIFERGTKRVEKKFIKPAQGSDLRHFYLPGNYGAGFDGNSDPGVIREGYDSRHEICALEGRNFITADQGGLWIVLRSSKPYFNVSMSECSCIVGVSEENLIVSYIGFSEMKELRATLGVLADAGVASENMYVIASVGSHQKEAGSRFLAPPRAVSFEDYENLGFREENIATFNYRPGDDEGRTYVLKSICKVIVNDGFIFKYTGDYRQHAAFERCTLIGDYTSEQVFDILLYSNHAQSK
jgi:hypothetical protein